MRKKLHRNFLTTVCGYVVTFDDWVRLRLIQSEPGTPFPINGGCKIAMQRLVQGKALRYWVKVVRKVAPGTVIVVYWAEEFPSVRDEAVIFSADDLGGPWNFLDH